MPRVRPLSEFRARIAALPNDFDKSDVLIAAFRLDAEPPLEVFYAPVDGVNPSAKVALIGITPGWAQVQAALRIARDAIRSGASNDEVRRQVEQGAAFGGPTRRTLVDMLDGIRVAECLGLSSTDQLWGSRADLLHATSVIRYPVFRDGQNYRGSSPRIVGSVLLRGYVESILSPELQLVSEALLVPLGRAAGDGLRLLVDAGELEAARVLFGVPHPSGANGHRVRQYAERQRELARQVSLWAATHWEWPMSEVAIEITANGVRNSYISLRTALALFDPEVIGGSSELRRGRQVSVDWGGGTVRTDIAGDKAIFRKRAWQRAFIHNHHLKAGDWVTLRRDAQHRYSIRPRLTR